MRSGDHRRAALAALLGLAVAGCPADRAPGGAPRPPAERPPTSGTGAAGATGTGAGASGAPAAATTGPEDEADALVLELRRRRDAGELNEARRKPDPCPEGDRERLAWFDGLGLARRFSRTGPLPAAAGLGEGEATRDHYLDAAGRTRLVVIDGTGAAGRFRRRLVLAEDGRRLVEDPPGPAPWPGEDLALRDGTAAFWARSRCPR